MAFTARILADSRHPDLGIATGYRLTTMELTYPRIIHSEFMTHRQFSRNAASSRAIPIEKMLARIEAEPFIPLEWGSNKAGMVAGAAVADPRACEAVWLHARDDAVYHARYLNTLGLHKQTVNRIVEPWMWITVIATAVDHGWENFFKLRCAPDAEPHIQRIAYAARTVYDTSTPKTLGPADWHTPLTSFEGDELLKASDRVKVSVGRCARVSYLTHEGKRDVSADIEMHDRLSANGHWSPFEHVAQPWGFNDTKNPSNFGAYWFQYRKLFQNEYCRRAPR